jgi:hypothetical protein
MAIERGGERLRRLAGAADLHIQLNAARRTAWHACQRRQQPGREGGRAQRHRHRRLIGAGVDRYAADQNPAIDGEPERVERCLAIGQGQVE